MSKYLTEQQAVFFRQLKRLKSVKQLNCWEFKSRLTSFEFKIPKGYWCEVVRDIEPEFPNRVHINIWQPAYGVQKFAPRTIDFPIVSAHCLFERLYKHSYVTKQQYVFITSCLNAGLLKELKSYQYELFDL